MTTKCLSTVQIMCGINTVDVQKSQLPLKKKGKDEKKTEKRNIWHFSFCCYVLSFDDETVYGEGFFSSDIFSLEKTWE